MRLFRSVDHLDEVLGDRHVKWRRAVQALRRAPTMSRGVAASVGDSLTYWVESASSEDDRFVTHRRYLSLLHPLDGELVLELAKVSMLQPADAYEDTRDRQHLFGSGEQVVVQGGQIGVVDVEEAIRVISCAGPLAVVRLTVEGATFANK